MSKMLTTALPWIPILTMACLIFAFPGCSSAPSHREIPAPSGRGEELGPIPQSGATPPARSKIPAVDLLKIQSEVGLNLAREQLGYREKSVNVCSPDGSNHSCSRLHFLLIQFQIVCRNTEDTVSEVVTQADTRAVAHQVVHWASKKWSGDVMTDAEGFGQIRLLVPNDFIQSIADQHVRMTLGGEFLYLSIPDVRRILTPLSWCRE